MTEDRIDGHLMEQAAGSPEMEVDRLVEQLPHHLVEQLPHHLLEQEPLLGPLLATHRPNTEVRMWTSHFNCHLLPSLGGVHSDSALPSDSD